MYMTKQKFDEIKKKNHSALLVLNDDVGEALKSLGTGIKPAPFLFSLWLANLNNGL